MKIPKRINIADSIVAFDCNEHYTLCSTDSSKIYKWGMDHDKLNVYICPVEVPLKLEDCERRITQSQYLNTRLLRKRGYIKTKTDEKDEEEDSKITMQSIFSQLITYSPAKVYVCKIACSENHSLMAIL